MYTTIPLYASLQPKSRRTTQHFEVSVYETDVFTVNTMKTPENVVNI